MSRAQDYFDRSNTYAAAAEVASDAGSRARLLQLAQHWAHLGQLAARNDVPSQALPTDPEVETLPSQDGVGRNSGRSAPFRAPAAVCLSGGHSVE